MTARISSQDRLAVKRKNNVLDDKKFKCLALYLLMCFCNIGIDLVWFQRKLDQAKVECSFAMFAMFFYNPCTNVTFHQRRLFHGWWTFFSILAWIKLFSILAWIKLLTCMISNKTFVASNIFWTIHTWIFMHFPSAI